MVSISIRHLTKKFGGQAVLSDVNLEIEKGELFFLLGPSGCGKTTLLRHIAGFYEPDGGAIFFDDEDVTDLPVHRRGTGMMFQSYALWPHLSVAQNVAFGLEERKRPRAEIDQRVNEVLDLVQLGGMGARRIQQLSGGQQQRVALARALVIRPRCLLLDEPLSNLDAKLRMEMRSEIRRICKEFGLTGIYVTHDRDEALSMADRLAIMDGGRLAQVGSPDEIYKNPASRMVAEFIGEANFIEGRVIRESSRPGQYDVDCGFATLRSRPNNDEWRPVQGQALQLAVRPEAMTFGDVRDSPNRFPGRIISTTYLGATVQYVLQVTDEILMKVCEMNPRDIRVPSRRDDVMGMCSVADLVMLRK
jgi:spermidine/putrescine ABC transporter ATP-binding subunit